ncbi:hypothetical protein [Clavibacter sp. VKM Ac-2872]|uniref:hypothetical protein n=1 Tax=Clavibacter sp. VKM Ac-2872 TaxID=2783812 RepID=UPI00188AF0CB|nr:hypothetical protein [Clavibacter sp. VKM Ac-2872]MBF4625534.1 hypothetical protein [Clavibacter sp. VKM Ac-2872]
MSESTPRPTMPHEIVLDHDEHRILIDGVEFPHLVGEDIHVEQQHPRFGTVDLTLLAERVTVIGEPRRRPGPPASIGGITGAILVRVGDAEPAELGTFTLPVRTATAPLGGGVIVSSGTDRLQRAMAAFAAALEEE